MPGPASILAIQSSVSFGHVGNSAAVFPLQRLGFEVWPIDTLRFSNHPGYGAWRGRLFEPAFVAELLGGVAERGALQRCTALLTGYLGDPANGTVVLDAAARLRDANPEALWCCDPVMGDTGSGLYVRQGIPEFFRERAVPAADIVMPNQFELEQLTGRRIASLDDAVAAARALAARGPRIVLVTSLARTDAPPDRAEMLAVAGNDAWLVETPLLPIAVNGAGDALAALFLGHFLRSGSVGTALGLAASAIFAVVEATHRSGEREIQLIAAQDELAAPRRRFTARRL